MNIQVISCVLKLRAKTLTCFYKMKILKGHGKYMIKDQSMSDILLPHNMIDRLNNYMDMSDILETLFPYNIIEQIDNYMGVEEHNSVTKRFKWMNFNRVYHRKNKPAYIQYKRGPYIVCVEEWYKHGLYYREQDNPTHIEHHGDGGCHKKWFNDKRQLHRDNAPAWIIYYSNGNIHHEYWYQYGQFAPDKPHHRSYDESGNLIGEYWMNHMGLHRINGPARIVYYTNGKVKSEEWLINNNWNRNSLHADYICYSEDGQITYEEWKRHIDDFIHLDDCPLSITHDDTGCNIVYVKSGNEMMRHLTYRPSTENLWKFQF